MRDTLADLMNGRDKVAPLVRKSRAVVIAEYVVCLAVGALITALPWLI